jgi:hypothetical protein
MGSWRTGYIVALGGGLHELPGGVGVADRGIRVESEHRGQVEWPGPWTRDSSSWRSTCSWSSVAFRPQKVRVIQTLLTGPVLTAVTRLTSR